MNRYSFDGLVSQSVARRDALLGATGRYFLSAMFAGSMIAIAMAVSMRLGQLLAANGSPYFALAYAGFFGTALVCIIVSRTDLFTSNVMFMTVARLCGRVTTGQTLASWTLVYAGNLAGILLFTAIWALAGGLGHYPLDHIASRIATIKTEGSFSKIFWAGVLCNWLVCLAVWLPAKLENEMAKIALVFILVFAFFFSGFEHCIASMALFALVGAHSPESLTLAAVMNNLVPATLGNIAGGAIGVGLVAWVLERHTLPAATTSALNDEPTGAALPQSAR
ncbi:MAG: formate/nitrite transporter family protein [Burkholderiaceae bacterium]